MGKYMKFGIYQMPLLNENSDICSKARGINFGLSLNLYPYLVYRSNKDDSVESAY